MINEMSLSLSLSLSPSLYTVRIPYYDRSNRLTISCPSFRSLFAAPFPRWDQSHSWVLASHDPAMAMEWWVPILKGPRLMLDDFYWFLGDFQAPGPDIRLPACYTKFQLAIAKKPKQIRDASPNLWAPGTAGTPASKAWTQTTGLLLALRRRSMENT